MVQLGVDVSSMRTVSRLSDGIELALSLVGKTITDKVGDRQDAPTETSS